MQIFLFEVTDFPVGRLGPEESRHCMKALRHQIGDELFCIDGVGCGYRARIMSYEAQSTQVEILESFPGWGEHGTPIRLIVSPLRLKDRFEWLVEKAVELGVSEIFPVQCRHTDKHKAKFKASRLETLILTATKQCKRSRIPVLHPLQTLNDFLSAAQEGLSFIAYCEAKTPLQQKQAELQSAVALNLLIGPEGDFTEAEVAWAESHGFQRVSLGAARLRTETAGMYGLSIFKMIKGF